MIISSTPSQTQIVSCQNFQPILVDRRREVIRNETPRQWWRFNAYSTSTNLFNILRKIKTTDHLYLVLKAVYTQCYFNVERRSLCKTIDFVQCMFILPPPTFMLSSYPRGIVSVFNYFVVAVLASLALFSTTFAFW